MYTKVQDLKDWKFWFKVIGALNIIGFLIYQYISGILSIDTIKMDDEGNPIYSSWAIFKPEGGEPIGYDYFGYTLNFFSYFTIQSNIFIAVWFIVAATKHRYQIGENKNSFVLSRTVTLLLTVYIMITGVIFNFLLLPPIAAKGGLSAEFWITNTAIHTLSPLMMLIYVMFFNTIKYEKRGYGAFFKKEFGLGMAYPLVYLFFALIRGEMVYRAYGSDWSLAQKHSGYPYFFLEIHNPNALAGLPGIAWLFIAAIAIIAIIIGFGQLTNYFINRKTQSEINVKPVNKELKK
ncbi:Pr6Pr family membrane protein [Spiroplasma culicicola]|uniref:Transmembrane protein n=1 Tax=Spiroplasma culicicola AES-1 TaxID=1276246 RepID=W6A7H7_9MOLU|nr:Pr6Pr family membrane protein [Spiroplasma culicicola]AHI52936.1 hypothetical protein SCULI_v1c05950 [Spiroplasma culicicola AES-1]